MGSVQENLELESDEPENFDSIAKLCLTRWTVRSTALQKIIANYDPLSNVWDICLDENLDTETRSRIIGCPRVSITNETIRILLRLELVSQIVFID